MGNTPPAILAGPKHLPPLMSEAALSSTASDIFIPSQKATLCMHRSDKRDLTGSRGVNKYSVHIGSCIGGKYEEARSAGLITLRRSDQFLPILEYYPDLFPHNRFGGAECFFLLVLTIPVKVLHKKYSLQYVDINIKRLGTGRGIQRQEMKNVFIGHEIARITL